jgi:hypothetical protein
MRAVGQVTFSDGPGFLPIPAAFAAPLPWGERARTHLAPAAIPAARSSAIMMKISSILIPIPPGAKLLRRGVGSAWGGKPKWSSCANRGVSWRICQASATRVRSNAPGRCPNCLKQRPTRLREYPSCHHSRYLKPYRTSIGADLFRCSCGWRRPRVLRGSTRDPGGDGFPFDLARFRSTWPGCSSFTANGGDAPRGTKELRPHLAAALETFERIGARPWSASSLNLASLGHEQCDVCLSRPGEPPVVALTLGDLQRGVVSGLLRRPCFSLSRRISCTISCTNLVPELRVSTVGKLRDHALPFAARERLSCPFRRSGVASKLGKVYLFIRFICV